MLRFLAGAASALLIVTAGFFFWQSRAQRDEGIPPAPEPQAVAAPSAGPPQMPPAADAPTKEERRFDRADRNDDGRITVDELYQPRRTAFARLDTNRDGRLSFEEWAVRTTEKFSGADRDRDRALTRDEYATTAPRRRAARRNCAC